MKVEAVPLDNAEGKKTLTFVPVIHASNYTSKNNQEISQNMKCGSLSTEMLLLFAPNPFHFGEWASIHFSLSITTLSSFFQNPLINLSFHDSSQHWERTGAELSKPNEINRAKPLLLFSVTMALHGISQHELVQDSCSKQADMLKPTFQIQHIHQKRNWIPCQLGSRTHMRNTCIITH